MINHVVMFKLKTDRVHPDHLELVRYLEGIREQTAAVDFEF